MRELKRLVLDLLTRSLVREWTHHDLSCEALHTNTTPLTPVSVRFSSRPCRHLSSCCCWLCKQWCLPREVGHHQVYTRVMYDQDIIVCPGSRLEHRLPCLISSRTLGESSTINLLHEGFVSARTHMHTRTHQSPIPHCRSVDGMGIVGGSPYACNKLPDAGNTCSGWKKGVHEENKTIPWPAFITDTVV